jgi:hypothetical protein
MNTNAKPRMSRGIDWLRETWFELVYLQRRLIELQMQAPSLRIPPEPSQQDELERAYALPTREPDHGLG